MWPNTLHDAYVRASRGEKAVMLDPVVDTTGIGRSSARRCLSAPSVHAQADRFDRHSVTTRRYSDQTRRVLEQILMGLPHGKYVKVMAGQREVELWQPALHNAWPAGINPKRAAG